MFGTNHQFATNQASPSSSSNDMDRLSSKADWGSDSEDSLGCDETSEYSPPYRGPLEPFDFQPQGIAGLNEGPVKSDEKHQPRVRSLLSEMIGHRANATAGKTYEASWDVTTSNDIDGSSLEVEFESVSEGSLGFDEASNSSPPYTGSPAPFEHHVEGTGGWALAAAKSEENCHQSGECLIPSNVEEAKSIYYGYRQALEQLVGYESALVDPTNISTVSRRHHLDAVGNPPNANATLKRLENKHLDKPASVFQDPSSWRSTERTINDPEKQAPNAVAGTSRRRYHYGGGYTLLVVALILGIVLYVSDVTKGFGCSSNVLP